MNTEEYFIFVIGIAIIINIILVPTLIQSKQDTINLYLKISPFIYNPITITLLITSMIEISIYFIYKKISNEKKRKREIEHQINKERNRIKHLLSKDLENLNYYQLRKLFDKLENPFFNYISLIPYKEDIKIKLKEINSKLIELEHRKELHKIEDYKKELNEEVNELEQKKKELRDKEEEKKDKIRKRLGVGYKDVFKKENLTENEIKAIKEEEFNPYDAVNEYCVVEKEIIPVLVRKIQHHSPTHTFLVWSVKKLLKRYSLIESIINHETRDADITFRIKRKLYAIEIEKGSLLKKKKQLRQKIEFLNEEYGTRWIVLASNRNLVKEYRKYGKSSTRKDLQKNIEKWIKEAKYS